MSNKTFHSHAFLLILAVASPVIRADQLPTYQELPTDLPVRRKLRDAPTMLSRFPTTTSIALCGDKKQMRTVDINGQLWQWPSLRTDEPTLIAETNSEPACAILSNDARLLAFADPDGSVALMDIESQDIRFRDTTAIERTVTLCFSTDSRALASVTSDGKVRVWKVEGGEVIHQFETAPSSVQTMSFSPNGDYLAITSFSREVKLFRLESHAGNPKHSEPRVISVPYSNITALAFTHDGKRFVIATADGSATVHSLANHGAMVSLGTRPFAIWRIAFQADGQRMAAGSWDGTIKVWDTNSWEEVQSIKTHEESVAAMVFDADNGLISAGLDGRLLYWPAEVPGIRASAAIAGRNDSVWVAVYSPDGKRLFVGGRENRFEIWNTETKELLISRNGHPTTRCALFSSDGQVLATGGDDGQIFLCSAKTGETRKVLLRHPGSVSAVVFTENGDTLVSGCDGGDIKLWNTSTGEETACWQEHQQQVYCASISPDGKWLVTGGGNWTTGDAGELIVWDLKAGRVHAKLEGHRLAVWSIVFLEGGERFASSDSSGAVKIWNVNTLKEERTLQHTTWVRALALSPDGSTLAVGRGDGSVRLWDTAQWEQKASCEDCESFSFSLNYSPSGEWLVNGAADGTVLFWPSRN